MSEQEYSVVIPEAPEGLETQTEAAEKWVGTALVTDQKSRDLCATAVSRMNQIIKTWKAHYKPLKADAKALHKKICDAEHVVIDPLERAKGSAIGLLGTYDRAQAEIARKAQAEAQAKIDAETERERQRKLKAAEKLKTPELKMERIEQAEEIVAPVVKIAAPTAKVQGESVRVLWRAELVSLDELIKAAAGGNELAKKLLIFDQAQANKLAVAVKNGVPVPGIKFESKNSYAYR